MRNNPRYVISTVAIYLVSKTKFGENAHYFKIVWCISAPCQIKIPGKYYESFGQTLFVDKITERQFDQASQICRTKGGKLMEPKTMQDFQSAAFMASKEIFPITSSNEEFVNPDFYVWEVKHIWNTKTNLFWKQKWNKNKTKETRESRSSSTVNEEIVLRYWSICT